MTAEYDRCVFVNCPFDEQYRPLFRAIIFTVRLCGYTARCALETDDSGETRATRIIDLIRNCRYGIHDLSRTELSDGLPRFNMPFEFGVFIGFKHSGVRKQRGKLALVLDRERYRYQRVLSDIAGQDIKAHHDKLPDLVRAVRDWLKALSPSRKLPGTEAICRRYEAFTAELPRLLGELQLTTADLDNYPDFYQLVHDWLVNNQPIA